MLNISNFHIVNVIFHDRRGEVPTLCYGGLRNIYHVAKAEPGFHGYELFVRKVKSSATKAYACSNVSVAIANIEALERGEEI